MDLAPSSGEINRGQHDGSDGHLVASLDHFVLGHIGWKSRLSSNYRLATCLWFNDRYAI